MSGMYKRVGGWEAEDGLQLPLGSSVVSSLRDRNRHNAQDRQRLLLTVIWHHSHSY